MSKITRPLKRLMYVISSSVSCNWITLTGIILLLLFGVENILLYGFLSLFLCLELLFTNINK